MMKQPEFECAIVGGGVAGLSAALTLARARRRTLVIDEGHPRNEVVPHSHGFLTRDGAPPPELLQLARAELEQYPTARAVRDRVIVVEQQGDVLSLKCASGSIFEVGRVVLAIGVRDELPNIEGVEELWGKSVFTCPYCDGWEYRNRPIAIRGCASDGVKLAQQLYRWSQDIVVLCPDAGGLSREERAWLDASGVLLQHVPIRKLHGKGGCLERIELDDGSELERAALFLCVDLAPRSELPKTLGCRVRDDGGLEIDDCNRTTVERVYAAGDVVTERHQISLAVASGARAAMSVNDDLVTEDTQRLVRDRRR